MTKREIAEIVSLESGLTQEKALKAIDSFLETVKQRTLEGEKIELRGFGTFYLKELKKREIFSPVLKKKVDAPPSYKVMFKPGKALKEIKGD